jgi:transposase
MSKQKRRKYTDEFKAEAVRLVLEQGLSVSQVAEDLGISRNLLSTWRKKISEDITGSDEVSSAKEVKRLRRENAVLREERDILKKAARYFAKESK